MEASPNSPCPCGLPAAYAACCGLAHGGTPAADAERLMRSRYSAYVLGLADYLRDTWHPQTRPETLQLEDAPGQRTRWLGLTVHAHEPGPDGSTAQVRFTARYRIGGASAVKMTEHSRFVRSEGRWYYLDAL